MEMAERIKMLRAMETVCRNINDEEVFEHWLINGVADGDIEEDTKDEELVYYCGDKVFAAIMQSFLECMKYAHKSGGLYCDKVVSKHNF